MEDTGGNGDRHNNERAARNDSCHGGSARGIVASARFHVESNDPRPMPRLTTVQIERTLAAYTRGRPTSWPRRKRPTTKRIDFASPPRGSSRGSRRLCLCAFLSLARASRCERYSRTLRVKRKIRQIPFPFQVKSLQDRGNNRSLISEPFNTTGFSRLLKIVDYCFLSFTCLSVLKVLFEGFLCRKGYYYYPSLNFPTVATRGKRTELGRHIFESAI